jgi:hypothetical protein
MKNRCKHTQLIYLEQTFLKFFIETVLQIVEKAQKNHLNYLLSII